MTAYVIGWGLGSGKLPLTLFFDLNVLCSWVGRFTGLPQIFAAEKREQLSPATRGNKNAVMEEITTTIDHVASVRDDKYYWCVICADGIAGVAAGLERWLVNRFTAWSHTYCRSPPFCLEWYNRLIRRTQTPLLRFAADVLYNQLFSL